MKNRVRTKIIIIGAVGTALNIIEQMLDARDNYNQPIDPAGIIIDSFEKGNMISGVPVLGTLKEIPVFLSEKDLYFLFALYKPEMLKERYELLQSLNIPLSRFMNFFHPGSYFSGSFSSGVGNIVLSNSTIQSNVILGNFNMINSNVSVEHDTIIGNGNFLAAGSCLGSNVHIGNHCFIGLNSSIRENIVLGNNVFVGMQSAVLKNFNDTVVTGIPAKQLRKK